MSLKLFGSLLILISGSTAGWIIAEHYLKRIKQIQQLKLALNIYITEISYSSTVLPEVLKTISQKLDYPLSLLFNNAGCELNQKKGVIFSDIWYKHLQENYKINALYKQDINILKEWGQHIGNSSLEGQQKINKLTLKRLDYAEKQARELAGKRVKLTRYTGVLISILIIILFL